MTWPPELGEFRARRCKVRKELVPVRSVFTADPIFSERYRGSGRSCREDVFASFASARAISVLPELAKARAAEAPAPGAAVVTGRAISSPSSSSEPITRPRKRREAEQDHARHERACYTPGLEEEAPILVDSPPSKCLGGRAVQIHCCRGSGEGRQEQGAARTNRALPHAAHGRERRAERGRGTPGRGRHAGEAPGRSLD